VAHFAARVEGPAFVFAFVLAVAFALVIGPGFSPDIKTQKERGFSP
jgi:hypothetical protein